MKEDISVRISRAHVSEARCSDRLWHTVKSFVSDF